MAHASEGQRFYFYALNSVGRITVGDSILIDTNREVALGSIALTFPELILQKVEPGSVDFFIGVVVRIIIEQ